MKFGSTFMIQRPENNPRIGDTVVPHIRAFVFWDNDGILHLHYPESGTTIMAKYYVAFLDKVKHQLVKASFQKQSCLFKTMLLPTRQPLHIRNSQVFTLKF
jgi:hypothetical protein